MVVTKEEAIQWGIPTEALRTAIPPDKREREFPSTNTDTKDVPASKDPSTAPGPARSDLNRRISETFHKAAQAIGGAATPPTPTTDTPTNPPTTDTLTAPPRSTPHTSVADGTLDVSTTTNGLPETSEPLGLPGFDSGVIRTTVEPPAPASKTESFGPVQATTADAGRTVGERNAVPQDQVSDATREQSPAGGDQPSPDSEQTAAPQQPQPQPQPLEGVVPPVTAAGTSIDGPPVSRPEPIEPASGNATPPTATDEPGRERDDVASDPIGHETPDDALLPESQESLDEHRAPVVPDPDTSSQHETPDDTLPPESQESLDEHRAPVVPESPTRDPEHETPDDTLPPESQESLDEHRAPVVPDPDTSSQHETPDDTLPPESQELLDEHRAPVVPDPDTSSQHETPDRKLPPESQDKHRAPVVPEPEHAPPPSFLPSFPTPSQTGSRRIGCPVPGADARWAGSRWTPSDGGPTARRSASTAGE